MTTCNMYFPPPFQPYFNTPSLSTQSVCFNGIVEMFLDQVAFHFRHHLSPVLTQVGTIPLLTWTLHVLTFVRNELVAYRLQFHWIRLKVVALLLRCPQLLLKTASHAPHS